MLLATRAWGHTVTAKAPLCLPESGSRQGDDTEGSPQPVLGALRRVPSSHCAASAGLVALPQTGTIRVHLVHPSPWHLPSFPSSLSILLLHLLFSLCSCAVPWLPVCQRHLPWGLPSAADHRLWRNLEEVINSSQGDTQPAEARASGSMTLLLSLRWTTLWPLL